MKINVSITIELSKKEEKGFSDSIRENYGSSLINLSLESMDPDFRDGEIWQRDNDFSKPDPHYERKNPCYIAWMKEQEKKEEDLRMLRERLSHPTEEAPDLSDAEWGDIPDLIRKYLGMD